MSVQSNKYERNEDQIKIAHLATVTLIVTPSLDAELPHLHDHIILKEEIESWARHAGVSNGFGS